MQQALTLEERNGGDAWHQVSSQYSAGDLMKYIYVVAYYGSAEAAVLRGSDYEAVAETESPVYTVSNNGGYYVPYNLQWSSPVRGCPYRYSGGHSST